VNITVRVCADDTKVVVESNETNNCKTNNFTCPIPEKPDLVVIEMSEEPVRADGHVIVHFIIQNNGTADAGESYATLYIDNMLVETQNVLVPVIAPNGRFVGAFALELCPNDKDIDVKVCADDTKVVVESNETNNCRTNTFTCPSPGPDLVIAKTVVTTINNPAQCNYRVDYTVTNIGNAIADWCCGNNNSVALFVNGNLGMLDDNIPALGPGASWDGDFDWQSNCLGPNTINLTVCADHYNVVDEGNESNNCEINIVPCGVEGLINVVKIVNRTDIVLGDLVRFTGTVSNIGCCCCALTDIYVNDTLPACLDFVSATGGTYTIVGRTIHWDKVSTLACGANMVYTIDARLVDCCYDVDTGPLGPRPMGVNTMTANATTCRGNPVTHSDTAKVYPDTTVRMDITKVVWNATSLTWGDSTNATNGTDVQFKCTVHNNGTCRNLTYLQVWDEMSDSLEYNWSTAPYNLVPIEQAGPGNSTILYWQFMPNVVTLAPCEWLNFTINATVRNGTPGEVDTNTLRVRAWSEEWWTGAWATIFRSTPAVEVTRSP
jgi:uncharacterized repeat protein (TIGR01451 family)